MTLSETLLCYFHMQIPKDNQDNLSFRPLYKKLAEKISVQILEAKPRNGHFFCTLSDLCEKHNTSITTVRRAVALLTAQGFISCKAGEGVIVKDFELLRKVTSHNFRVLILHHHFRKQLNDFFELRLSALIQGFSSSDISVQVIYRELLDDVNSFYWQSSQGIVCGNSMVNRVLSACQTYGMRQVLVINPPANVILPENFHPVYYDFDGLVRLSCQFWERTGCRKIIMIRNDRSIIPPPEVEIIDLEEYPTVEAGHRIAERFLNVPSNTGFWVTDDFVGLGIYDFFRARGENLNEQRRLLVNSSPSRLLIEELGIATIGFCPLQIGELSAKYFAGILKSPEQPRDSLVINAQANAVVSQGIAASDQSE